MRPTQIHLAQLLSYGRRWHAGRRAGFTLLELLVVIAIIATVAAALVPAINSIQHTADATRCQAHMKNLHQACMNHLADTGKYPFAGSYEYFNARTLLFSHQRGWVAWVRRDLSTDDPYKGGGTVDSQASQFMHSGWSGKYADRSIRDGAIFKYTGSDMSTYLCPRFERMTKSIAANPRRSYAMNFWFGSRRTEAMPEGDLKDFRKRDLRSFQDYEREPSRMGMFVELQQPVKPPVDHAGEEAFVGSRADTFVDDATWDYYEGRETYGASYHRRSGSYYGHVIFVDGHVEFLKMNDDVANKNVLIGSAKF
ncbi:MAG: prepilin-type N-terminal cleavage/methylation domain-containing protein [Kiritimatiellae bacterium]|nr:prepilin-type N-terminal cleavage/methylation domain-containing protein [Kiritimatiellia bacterium]